jgi:hypothetical protein
MALVEKFVSSAGAGTGDGSSQGNAQSWANFIAAGMAGGNRYNVLDAISRGATADALVVTGGSTTSPAVLRFGNAAAGNGYGGRSLTNGSLVTTNMPLLTYTTGSLALSGSFALVESMNITGAPAGPLFTCGADSAIVRSLATYTGTNAAGTCITTNTRVTVEDCDAIMAGASGGLAAISAVGSPRIKHNRITGKSAPGISVPTAGAGPIEDNIIYRSTDGIITAAVAVTPLIFNNLIVLCSSDGIELIAATTQLHMISGNRITDCGAWGVNTNGVAAMIDAFNRFDRNVSGAVSGAADWMTATAYNRDVTSLLQAAEYNNAATDDYRIVSGAPTTGGGSFAQVAASAAGAGGKTLLGVI